MASPVVEAVAETPVSTAATSHTLNLPAGITAGDLLVICMDKGSTAASVNALTGWTELLDENLANGLYVAYRLADGTEGGTVGLTLSASTRSASIVYRISGAEDPATQAPQLGTTATGTSATPDPPTSATPASSKDYLFIAFAGMAGEEADDDTWGNTSPTNYTPSPPRQKSCGIAGTNLGGLILSAERALTTGVAENPGTFGVDVSNAWRAQTLMITPGVGSVSGSGSPSLGAISAAAAGAVSIAAAGSVALALAFAATGAVDVRGSGSPSFALSASGVGTVGSSAVSGSGSPALPAITASAAGAVFVAGNGSPALAGPTASGGGQVRVAGTSTATLAAPAGGGAGTVEIRGSGSSAFSIGAVGASTVLVRGAGSAIITFGGSGSGAIGSFVEGSGAPVLPGLSASGTGGILVTGMAVIALPSLAGSGTADGGASIEWDGPPIRTVMMGLVYFTGSMGLQIGIRTDQWGLLQRGRPVIVTREQLHEFQHPLLPTDLDEHELWMLTDGSTLTPA